MGIFWESPSVPCICALSGVKAKRQWAEFGQWENGDLLIVCPSDSPSFSAGWGDRFTLADTTESFSTVVVRTGTESVNFYNPVFDAAVYLDGNRNRVSLDPPNLVDGVLIWPSGAPPSGVRYTLTGRGGPEYYVFNEIPMSRTHHGGSADLPRRIVLRRLDLFGRQ